MVIGYLSFYFKIENFTDRVMVVLTTMLVIATIISSIESVSIAISYKRLLHAKIRPVCKNHANCQILSSRGLQ